MIEIKFKSKFVDLLESLFKTLKDTAQQLILTRDLNLLDIH